MARRGSGLGFVLVIVTLVVVALLVARSWNAHAPAAIEVTSPAGAAAVPHHGETEAAGALGDLPNLGQMRDETSQHAQRVEDALAEIE